MQNEISMWLLLYFNDSSQAKNKRKEIVALVWSADIKFHFMQSHCKSYTNDFSEKHFLTKWYNLIFYHHFVQPSAVVGCFCNIAISKELIVFQSASRENATEQYNKIKEKYH